VKFLAYIFDERGVSVDTDKFAVIQGFLVPDIVKRVQNFLGLASHYGRFVKAFSQV
jgi:hypothetical protein